MRPLFARYTLAEDDAQVTLVDRPDFVNYLDLADKLYNSYASQLDATDLLVIRPPVDRPIFDPRSQIDEIVPLRERAPRAAIHLLHSNDYRNRLSENLNESAISRLSTSDDRETFLDWLRQTELVSFVKRSTALFRREANYVYRSPSNKYCSMFLRVGSVQMSRDVLDAFFFWMLPYLRDRDSILAETWSISSIALNAARLLQRYDEPNHRRCRVDMLSAYHDGSPEVLAETQDALRRVSAGGERRALVLISAIMTGNSLERLKGTIEKITRAPGRFSYLTLYRLCAGPQIDALCDLSEGIEGGTFEPMERPDSGTVIEVDRHTYFPLHIMETPLKIEGSAARPGRSFFKRYQNTGAICVHRNSYDFNQQKYRHHAVYVDVVAMMKTLKFRRKLKAELDKVDPVPSLIVAPPHLAGKEMAEFASRYLAASRGIEPPISHHHDLHPDSQDTPVAQITALGATDLILTLDDVSVTGTRLSGYQKHLGRLGYQGRLHYLIGVARPESEGDWQNRVRNLRYRSGVSDQPHVVAHVESVILPNWNEDECPWCKELEFHRDVVKNLGESEDVRQPILDRLLALQNAPESGGLTADAFWLWPSQSRFVLERGSLFLNKYATEADVFAAVASALQQMRTWTDKQRLEAHYPHVTVLDTSDYLGNTFYESVLRVAILRAATRAELERWKDDKERERREMVREFLLVDSTDHGAMHLELLLGIVTRKIPKPELTDEDLERIGSSDRTRLVRLLLDQYAS